METVDSDENELNPTNESSNDSTGGQEIRLGYLGSILLVVGPFLPVMTVCLFVCVETDYIADWEGDGVIVMILGLISLALMKFERYRILGLISAINLLIIIDFLSDANTVISEPAYGAYVILVGALMTAYASFKKW